jgi:very-short-patch-repair endonuclease
LSHADRARKSGIPVTSPARTIVDLAATANATELERAIAEACAHDLTDERRISAAIERAPRHAGVTLLRTILGQPGGAQWTRSGGERAMLKLIRSAGLPAPWTNVPVAGFTADFVWQDERLIVEVDGYPFHSARAAFERDHRRDIVHKNAGYEVLRFTARQLDDEPLYVATVIARALERLSRDRG